MSNENVVWSKPDCPFCVKAKDLLDQNEIQYSEYEIGNGYTKEQLLEVVPDAKTVPQVFLDGNHVGGYDQLKTIYG